jgi:hypothetical protein
MHRKLLLVSLVGLALALVASCDKTEGNNDAKVDGYKPPSDLGPLPSDFGPPPAGFYLKKSGETVDITAPTGTEYLLIVPYSVSDVKADSIAFDVTITAGAASADGGISSGSYPVRITRPRARLRDTHPALWARWHQRLAVEAWTRKLAESAATSRQIARKLPDMTSLYASCKLSSECEDTEVCQGGSCTATPTIKTELFSSTATITANVKKKGTVAAVLVDPADTVAAGDVTAIRDKFEKIIYARDVGLFGNPKLKSNALSSDRNGDGLIWLVLTSKVQAKKAVGFFAATDFTTDAKSNQADILYIDATAKPADAYGIMAHELQHLLSYAAKVYLPEADGGAAGPLEALWLDEGQAHFAEDACGFGGENVLLLNQEVFPNFDTTSLLSDKDTLAMRGMAMTFVRYLFEAKGGVSYNADGSVTDKGGGALLAKLHTSSKQGTSAVTEIFGDFKGAFDRWIAAISLDGRGIAAFSKYVYGELIDDPAQSGVKIGLKLRSSTVQGPPEDEITGDKSDAIPNATAKFFKLTGKTGPLKVTVTCKDQDFRYGLFQVGK